MPPPPSSVRELDDDSLALVLQAYVDQIIADQTVDYRPYRRLCAAPLEGLCAALYGPGRCGAGADADADADAEQRLWKYACGKMGLNRIVRYTGAPTTWRGTLRALCNELNDTKEFFTMRCVVHEGDRAWAFHLMHTFPRKDCPLALAVLLDLGYSADGNIGRWRPPLCAAAKRGHVAVVEVLLAGGANPDLSTVSGKTPLMFACEHGKLQVVKVLLAAGANMEARDDEWKSALMYACHSGSYPVVRELLEQTPPPPVDTYSRSDWTPLMFAIDSRVPETVKELMKHRPWLNTASISGWTPIMLASRHMFSSAVIVDAILERNDVDLNMQNDVGETALIVATKLGNVAIVKALLRDPWRLDFNLQDNRGLTALMHAASRGGSDELLSALLDAGAEADAQGDPWPLDVNLQDNRGLTALMHAASRGGPDELLSALLDAGADVHLKSAEGTTAFTLYTIHRTSRAPAPPELWNRLQGRDFDPE